MKLDMKNFKWIRKPEKFTIDDDRVEIVTQPGTDLWQRTYYHFRNDNAPVLQNLCGIDSTGEKMIIALSVLRMESNINR